MQSIIDEYLPWTPDDVDWDSPDCEWGCECPLCQPRYAAEALALAKPDELAGPEQRTA